jgi:hypothetical protein
MIGRVLTLRLVPCAQFPDEPEPGLFYYSEDFRSSLHLCACGCGRRVILPIKPAGWRMDVSGTSVSLFPSVGNREFDCRSHYLIRNGAVIWLANMSDREVTASRDRDQQHIRAVHRISLWQRLRNVWAWLRGSR